ncbi:MAG: hypothetical protein KDD32_05360 [Bacteroidetes bacterium]|nr:hypothetical protein [Bacteroidota bacterium]
MNKASDDHLPHYRVRPRFKKVTDHSIEYLSKKISDGLSHEQAPCKGRVNPGYISLYLPIKEQHYWSPQLSLTLEESDEGTVLRGLYGPRPAVWTLFVFFYSLLGFATLVIAIIGFSKLSLDRTAPILWALPPLILTICSLYLVAYLGQKASHDQMLTLHQFLEKSTGLVIQDE